MATRYPAFLLPDAWFSPLGFASTSFGPAGRSAGHFLLTAAVAAVLAFSLFEHVPLRHRSSPPWMAVSLVAGGVAAFALARLGGPAIEAAMHNMSVPVFFSPTLLFSPTFLMVLLGFALLVAVAIVGVALGFRATGIPVGKPWGLLGATGAGVALGAAAWLLPQTAMAGTRDTITVLLAVGLVGGAWLAHAAARQGEGATIRLALVACTIGSLITIPLAAHARIQTAQDLLVERAERIGEASIPWLQYTMERTRQFLESEPSVAEAIVERNRDAALILWSRSPLRELDFATGLYLFDAEGELVSHFALTAEDLTDRARDYARSVGEAPFAVEGSAGTPETRWAVVPATGPLGRVGTAVAMTTGALDLRGQAPGQASSSPTCSQEGGSTRTSPATPAWGPRRRRRHAP
jgi:hypothetical protein